MNQVTIYSEHSSSKLKFERVLQLERHAIGSDSYLIGYLDWFLRTQISGDACVGNPSDVRSWIYFTRHSDSSFNAAIAATYFGDICITRYHNESSANWSCPFLWHYSKSWHDVIHQRSRLAHSPFFIYKHDIASTFVSLLLFTPLTYFHQKARNSLKKYWTCNWRNNPALCEIPKVVAKIPCTKEWQWIQANARYHEETCMFVLSNRSEALIGVFLSRFLSLNISIHFKLELIWGFSHYPSGKAVCFSVETTAKPDAGVYNNTNSILSVDSYFSWIDAIKAQSCRLVSCCQWGLSQEISKVFMGIAFTTRQWSK